MMTNISEVLSNLDTYIELFLNSFGIWGALLSCFLIIIESILPVLPLCVFVTLIFYTFGNIIGFIISWICTILGCMLSFYLCRSKVRKWFIKKIKDNKRIEHLVDFIDNMSLSSIAILVAIPFTPAFAVNIAAGLSNIKTKKFLIGIMIGKIFMVYFWGYIGTTLIECLTHPIYLLKILLMLLIAFIISKIVNKYLKLD